jgi:hypothetical protein
MASDAAAQWLGFLANPRGLAYMITLDPPPGISYNDRLRNAGRFTHERRRCRDLDLPIPMPSVLLPRVYDTYGAVAVSRMLRGDLATAYDSLVTAGLALLRRLVSETHDRPSARAICTMMRSEAASTQNKRDRIHDVNRETGTNFPLPAQPMWVALEREAVAEPAVLRFLNVLERRVHTFMPWRYSDAQWLQDMGL